MRIEHIAFMLPDPVAAAAWYGAHLGFRTARAMTKRLEEEGAAYDIASHRASPPGLRIWTGATVEPADVALLLPWLDWAWDEQRQAAKAA